MQEIIPLVQYIKKRIKSLLRRLPLTRNERRNRRFQANAGAGECHIPRKTAYNQRLQRNQKIEIHIECTLGSDSGVEDIDLCVLLGNLFENAIEGCKTLPEEKRSIKLRMATHVGVPMVTADNRFDGIVQTRNGEILSRKREGGQKGIGLSSVEAVAHKYGGELRCEQKDGLFMVSVKMEV